MLRTWKIVVVSLSVVALMGTFASEVYAQSGSHNKLAPPPARRQPVAAAAHGSGSHSRTKTTSLAMEGYCPVCLKDSNKWVLGKPQFNASYKGRTYYFPGQVQKKKFLANPAKYAPVLGGDCTVCKVEMGKQVPGNIRYGLFHKGQLYFFASAQQKAMFAAHPAKYEVKVDTKGSGSRSAAGRQTKAGSNPRASSTSVGVAG